MLLTTKRKLFWVVWLVIVLSGPISIIINSLKITEFSAELVITLIQRSLGTIAFSLIFMQIVIGRYMAIWVQLIGAKAYRIHVLQGIVAFIFALAHPLMENILVYKLSGSIYEAINAFMPGIDSKRDFYIGFGRFGLLLLIIVVASGFFRTKPAFRRNWRLLHIVNYVAFYSIAIHAWFIGTDIYTPPFLWVFWLSIIGISLLVVTKLAGFITKIYHTLSII